MPKQIELDTETLIDLAEMGLTQKEQALELGVSVPTLQKRIGDIQKKHGLLMQYRAIQSLQLTELQARCLEAITTDKIEQASLKDLVIAFKVLKDKELNIEGKPSEIKGLVAYLIEMEKEEAALAKPIDMEAAEEVEKVTREITDPEYIPEWEE